MNIHNINIDSDLSIINRTIVTVGMFDGIHIGHQYLLRMVEKEGVNLGLRPLVLTFDRHPRRVLGDNGFKMLTTADERLGLLEEYGVEELALLHFTPEVARLTACEFVEQVLLRQLGMEVLVLGYDNRFGNKEAGDFEQLSQLGRERGFGIMQQEELNRGDGVMYSSTRIRESLAMGDIEGANYMLGHRYTIGGMVVRGRGEGRKLGVPTANIACPDEKLLPSDGVYCALATTASGEEYRTVVNIGGQPTFGLEGRTIEAHLIGFHGDLYGTTLKLGLTGRLRDIHRYDNPERLADRIALDIRLASSSRY
ncbi:MAG: riboflavin biosynthesis protein RibF [Bacteroidales bacterium]|nr:riboflavin biosynthesis protein RibF [Bacteroidales bacterium]